VAGLELRANNKPTKPPSNTTKPAIPATARPTYDLPPCRCPPGLLRGSLVAEANRASGDAGGVAAAVLENAGRLEGSALMAMLVADVRPSTLSRSGVCSSGLEAA